MESCVPPAIVIFESVAFAPLPPLPPGCVDEPPPPAPPPAMRTIVTVKVSLLVPGNVKVCSLPVKSNVWEPAATPLVAVAVAVAVAPLPGAPPVGEAVGFGSSALPVGTSPSHDRPGTQV